VRGLQRRDEAARLRPAKGIHLVIPRERIPTQGCVTFQAEDARQLFLHPIGDVALLGTTDDWSEEIDAPSVTIEDVHYLLGAANRAFPEAALTTNDLRSVYAGVRPLVASEDAGAPVSSVSREHRVETDASGLISAWGGKLTTHRAMAEDIVNRAARRLAHERRGIGPSRTWELPLREERIDAAGLAREIEGLHGLPPACADELVCSHGAEALALLSEAPAKLRAPIGSSRFTWAAVPWALRRECAASLCDVLERRVRLAVFAIGQGTAELATLARVAGEAAGWDEARTREEVVAYADSVRRRYQIIAPAPRSARSAA
jgi:glycerol-3-phosphate dehydrogenase